MTPLAGLASLGATLPMAHAERLGIGSVLSWLSLSVGVAGAAVLLIGVARGLLQVARLELRSHDERLAAGRRVRHELAYYLLLGLELLVAADVLETIVTPTREHVLVLGGVVLIRTMIVVSLNWELGRERRADEAREGAV